MSLIAAVILATVFLVAQRGATSAAPAPVLMLDAPARVSVGQVIEISISIKNATDIAGYEMNLQYDPAAAHLNDLKQRQNDVKKLGRDVQAVGPVELANGVSFGAFSCPVNACAQPAGKTHVAKGARGTVKLGVVRLVADSAGPLTVGFGQSTFVDSSGNAVQVDLSAASLTIQVDGGQ